MIVILITAVMMLAEIAAGMFYGSMALLADGWHMATHVAAFGITLFAYRYARRHADNPRYSFGTGKVGVLGGFASAIALAMVALIMVIESLMRVFEPHDIRFDEAIVVAIAGLAVNIVCGFMLHESHDHDDDHDHDHQHAHQRAAGDRDHNLHAAYLHVVADALTSVLAILALLAGKLQGWVWLDPLTGIVGAAVIARWSWGLVRDSGQILLDGSADEATCSAIRHAIESDADNRISDLHVWHLGPGSYCVSVAVITHDPREPEHYKKLLEAIPRLGHLLVEVNVCADASSCPHQDQAPAPGA
jgi:cation diffusion facilitator family transporter